MSAPNDLPTQKARESAHIFIAPYSTVSVSEFNLDDHIGMRAAQLAALVRVIPLGNHSARMLSLAGRLADELNEQRKGGQSVAVLADQVAELLLRAQDPENGPCDLLWLGQQLADEVAALIASTDRTEIEGATA